CAQLRFHDASPFDEPPQPQPASATVFNPSTETRLAFLDKHSRPRARNWAKPSGLQKKNRYGKLSSPWVVVRTRKVRFNQTKRAAQVAAIMVEGQHEQAFARSMCIWTTLLICIRPRKITGAAARGALPYLRRRRAREPNVLPCHRFWSKAAARLLRCSQPRLHCHW